MSCAADIEQYMLLTSKLPLRRAVPQLVGAVGQALKQVLALRLTVTQPD